MVRRSWGSVALAVLIVGASLAGAVGSVSGQTAAYEKTWNGSPGQVVVDVGDYSGQINLEFNAPYLDQPLWAGTLSGEQIDSGRIRLTNQGAYEQVSVTVTGPSSSPSWDSGGVQVGGASYSVGSTGNDKNTDCGPLEEADDATGFEPVIDCSGYPGISDINTTGTDANQTKLDITQDALDTKATSDQYQASISNWVPDSRTEARIQGQNAYIRALNNGSSEASARLSARKEVQDYYARIQREYIGRWETAHADISYVRGIAANEAGLSERYVRESGANGDNHGYDLIPQIARLNETASKSLVNGETATANVITVGSWSPLDDGFYHVDTQKIGPWSGTTDGTQPQSGHPVVHAGIQVQPTATSNSTTTMMDYSAWASGWDLIKQESQIVQSDMDTLINNTYEEYQAGDIDNADLVDAYTLSERSPNESYQSWAARRLTTLGVNSPEALDQTGAFTVESGGESYRGILFLTEIPEGGVSAGQNYDAAALNGTEYIVTADSTEELTGTFTVVNITNRYDEPVQNVQYEDRSYLSANVSELREEYKRLNQLRAEIEAREEALISNSGIQEDTGDEPPIDPVTATILGAGLIALLIITQRN